MTLSGSSLVLWCALAAAWFGGIAWLLASWANGERVDSDEILLDDQDRMPGDW